MGSPKGRKAPNRGMPHWTDAMYLAKMKACASIDANGCWLWTKYLMPTGYADMSYRGKAYRAHRLMYMLTKGPVGTLHVMHSCDVRHCVNPDHLSLGTNHDNMLDCMKKGRPHRGHLMRSKTHCPKGHEYAKNSRPAKGRRDIPSRACVICQRMHTRKASGWPESLWWIPPLPKGQRPDFPSQRSGGENG